VPAASVDQIAQLTTTVTAMARQLEAGRLENYRLQAIQTARASGYELIDPMVTGNNRADIDASIQMAVAEYNFQHSRIEAGVRARIQHEAEVAAVAAQNGQPPLEPPQSTVTSVSVQPYQPPQAQPLSLPGFIAASGIPDGNPSALSSEQFAYLTSGDAVRNGDYARMRTQLHGALRAGAPRPSTAWSLSQNGPNLAPPLPIGQPYGSPPPAMGSNAYAGVQQPQLRTYAPPPPAPPPAPQQPFHSPQQLTPLAGLVPHSDPGQAAAAALRAVSGQHASAASAMDRNRSGNPNQHVQRPF